MILLERVHRGYTKLSMPKKYLYWPQAYTGRIFIYPLIHFVLLNFSLSEKKMNFLYFRRCEISQGGLHVPKAFSSPFLANLEKNMQVFPDMGGSFSSGFPKRTINSLRDVLLQYDILYLGGGSTSIELSLHTLPVWFMFLLTTISTVKVIVLQSQSRWGVALRDSSLTSFESALDIDNTWSACIIYDKPEEMGQCLNTSKIHHFFRLQSSAPGATVLH